MGGLLAREAGEHDFDVVRQVALTISRLWNLQAGQRGFEVFISPTRLQASISEGVSILEKYFPQPPGPFKRVATLVVLARLQPFFHFEPVLSPESNQRWLAKIVALLIPVGLAKMRVNLTPEGPTETWQSLDAWKGFPSPHYKLEFLQFLEGMDNYQWLDSIIAGKADLLVYRDKIITQRIARMIASSALSIEACYYWNEDSATARVPGSRIRGRCTDFFDATDIAFREEFDYDSHLFRAHQRRTGA